MLVLLRWLTAVSILAVAWNILLPKWLHWMTGEQIGYASTLAVALLVTYGVSLAWNWDFGYKDD